MYPRIRKRFCAARKPIVATVVLSAAIMGTWHWAGAEQRLGRFDAMPKAAEQAVRQAFPKARITSIEAEPQILVIYEVGLAENEGRMEAEVFVNGEVLSVEKQIATKDLPPAVAEALRKEAAGARLSKVEQKEVRAMISISRLPQPKTVYEAEYVRDGRTVEVAFEADGTLSKRKLAEDHDDDENEREISLDQVPAAARKTILKHAAGRRVHEVEVETRRGRTTYEAEWRENGEEVEITVTPDGKLLRLTKGEDDEEDDDD